MTDTERIAALRELAMADTHLTHVSNGNKRGSERVAIARFEKAIQAIAKDWVGRPLTSDEMATFG